MYREIRRLEEHNWWFVGMRRIADRLLAGQGRQFERALDLGCGSGGNLPLVARFAKTVVACDLSVAALQSIREKPIGLAADACRLPFADGAFDLINFFNVVEHIEDHRAALAEVRRVLAPGGVLLLATSAFQALWSDHDEVNHHCRRYGKGELRNLLECAGFEVGRMTFANSALLPPTFVVARWRRIGRKLGLVKPYETSLLDVPGPANLALTWLLTAEAKVLEKVDLPAGVSLFALARRAS
jgi:SAM-dependent methyltransferase